MECDRFKNLVKTWYVQVQNEALAPARMVTFMKQHVFDCRVCQNDPGVGLEVEKIIEIVLPPAKAKLQSVKAEPEEAELEIAGEEVEEEIVEEEESVIPDEEEGLVEEEEEEEEDEI